MKAIPILLFCAAAALVLVMLPPHGHAIASSVPQRTSPALAEAMSSHGIELGDAAEAGEFAAMTPVVYRQAGTQ